MKFIKLNKIENKEWFVNVAHIASVEINDEDSTWVSLDDGTKYLVTEFVSDIFESLGAEIVIPKGE